MLIYILRGFIDISQAYAERSQSLTNQIVIVKYQYAEVAQR